MDNELLRKIFLCKEHLSSLNGAKVTASNSDKQFNVVPWFQDLCDKIASLLLQITENVRKISTSLGGQAKEKMLLYLLQLNTALSVLIRIFLSESEHNIIITAARYCISKQICLCLDGLEEVLVNMQMDDDTEGFVKYMDAALERVTEIDVEKGRQIALNVCGEARRAIEEVLCHGMSIAQVALNDDCNSIKGGSKEVLSNMESLTQQINKDEPNVSMCNLFVDSCCDKLCALERKVNVAVLKLSLKVFSECTKPLEDLYDFCAMDDNLNGCEEDFDNLVADFDLHVDRMIQVGLFAVSCSTDTNCTLRMRSCLASLEALEGDLVPALTTIRSDPNKHNRLFANTLKNYWIKQALTLKKYIYCIIDPFAFCQVTYEVIREINEELEEKFKSSSPVDKDLVKPITLQTKILFEMLVVSVKDSPPENQETVKKYLTDVINVTVEIDAAADKLLSEKEICKENVFRVFKRCKIQENLLKKLLCSLGGNFADKSVINEKCEMRVADSETAAMEALMCKAKQILKDRSVLYRTPNKSRIVNKNQTRTKTPITRLVHLRNMQFTHSRLSNETSIDLQITDILDNLTTLSTSLMN
ncbi:PREDICTED: serendipity locus protein alpha isoform X2 [Nicrophorus vespilloides]|uniref:Serendipity locus protein alpha isoform X2 n=1 Tax=Nicrophorus vespilloides TaxID=110193 RepID=A0ABM1MTR3_NICVS|nr:PREDICTED: serendipity locus protein alpha isoform X2 [Nicrophorus vespilloides]